MYKTKAGVGIGTILLTLCLLARCGRMISRVVPAIERSRHTTFSTTLSATAEPTAIDVVAAPTPTPVPTWWLPASTWWLPGPTLTATPAIPLVEGCWYQVKRGDTLAKIGARYGVSVKAIARTNQLSNPDRIFPGQKLSIPSGTCLTSPTRTSPP